MATNFISVFGNRIKVAPQPHSPNIQYTGFPGAHGVTCMMMGSRGYPITVTGQLVAQGTDYRTARAMMVAQIRDIEQLQFRDAMDYFYGNEYYSNCIFEGFKLVEVPGGKLFSFTTEGLCLVNFVAYFRSMV